MKKLFLLAILTLELTGCASLGRAWKGLVSDEPEKPAADAAKDANKDGAKDPNGNAPSFNTNPNYGNYQDRQYKRVTKDNFVNNQQLEENSGSLWKKEGQGSYLFAQNSLRVLGDVINVEVDGRVSENLQTKVGFIKKSQSKFDAMPRPAAPQRISRVPRPENDDDRTPGAAAPMVNTKPVKPEVPTEVAKTEKDKKDETKFDPVTCRIVEKNADGSYRIKGTQSLVIGRKEYKLIVTGVVRADDINTDSIAASKIIESKFDLVATNRDVSQ